MKITKIGIIILLSLSMLTSCEEKTFNVVLNLVFSHNFTVNSTASSVEEYSITGKEINDQLDEVPDTASLDSIQISNMYVVIKALPGNTAQQVTVSGAGKYSAINNGEYFTLFNNNTFDMPAENDSVEVGIKNLVEPGIQSLKNILNDLVMNSSISDDAEASVKVESLLLPSESTVNAEITFYLQATTVFEYKTELLSAAKNGSGEYQTMVAGLYKQD